MTYRRFCAVSASALLAASASLAAPAVQPSIQQQFESATASLDAGKWQEALTTYEAIEQRLRAGNPRSLGIVRVRKASALVALGRDDEAETALRQGLPALPATDPSLAEDRYLALVTLGEISEQSLDYGEAIESFRAAAPLMTGVALRARALKGLILTDMFYDGEAALAEADAALAAAVALQPPDKRLEALFRNLRGRVLLNLGRPDEAKRELVRATTLLGGLTEKVDAADLAARSDLAIAALRSGDDETARKYLSWTGAGHFTDGFPAGADMAPPPCGEELAPTDVAIVEFSIRNDGSVGAAQPVYASRQGPSALAFARAVSGWSWKPEELAKIQPLFRMMTRVELRCSTSTERPSVLKLLGNDVDEWLAARGFPVEDPAGRSDARRLKPLREELARREAASGPDSLAQVPILADLSRNAIVPNDERKRYLARAETIARREKAPATVLAWFQIPQRAPEGRWRKSSQSLYAAGLRVLLLEPEVAADARAQAAVRLELAEALYHAKQIEPAIQVLQEIGTTTGLGQHDALRAAAFVRLASLRLLSGDEQAARASFAASGLSADQCSLVDSPPRLRRMAGSSDDFPRDALRWGFEGWAKVEYDLSASGEPVNVRPTIAYPPFVFGESGAGLVAKLRYERSFRPDGGLACGGMSQKVAFRLP